jgi:ribosomal protein S1
VKITEIDAERRRISLSIKQALPEWESRSQWQDEPQPAGAPAAGGAKRRKVEEFEREEEGDDEVEESSSESTFSADASLEAILEELKQKGIGRK